MSPGLALILTGLMVVGNAFFVASEFAIVKIRPTRVRELVKLGGRRAQVLSIVTGRLPAYLSANQLGVTLASLALGWVGEPTLARVLEPLLTPLGLWVGIVPRTLAFVLGFVCITFLHTAFGELVPKVLALQLTEPVALWTAPLVRGFYFFAFPLTWTLTTVTNLFLRLIGLRATTEAEMLHSSDELRLVLQHVKLDPGARRLIDRVFDYTHRLARHVMTLRRDVITLTAGLPFEENLKTALNNQYTRYPLVDPITDQVVGYVHIKDVVAALASGRPPRRMREIVRQPIYVSEDTRLEWMRREFQRRRVHIAIVLGEGEKFVGIVTMEDLLEEFVGEIQDEQDVGEVPPIVRSPDGRFEIEGRLTLDVAARDLGVTLKPERADIDTVGAYIEAMLQRPPMPGDVVEAGGFRLTAIEIRDGRIRRVRGEPVPTSGDEAEEG
jgi:CBS domain containing-hemolysin-like protein